MSSNRDFRVLLVQLAEKMDRDNIESIIAIEDLPKKLKGQSGLEVLLQLEIKQSICASNPSSLEDLFKTIGRIDLAKKVKDFIKLQKKGKKTKGANSKDIHLSLEANLEVTLVQMRLLKEQLEHLKEKAEQVGPKCVEDAIVVAKEVAENLVERQLLEAMRMIKRKSIESSGSDDSPPVTLTRSNIEAAMNGIAVLPKDFKGLPSKNAEKLLPPITAALPPQSLLSPNATLEDQDDGLYAEVYHHQPTPSSLPSPSDSEYYQPPEVLHHRQPTQPPPSDSEVYYQPPEVLHQTPPTSNTEYYNLVAKNQHFSRSVMVTGIPKKPANKGTSKPPPPPKPKNYKKKSKEPVEGDTTDYTGDYTGGTTGGDSGFSDISGYLKTPLSPAPTPSHHKYTPINREEVNASYYKSARDNKFQEIMKDKSKQSDTMEAESERIYENYN